MRKQQFNARFTRTRLLKILNRLKQRRAEEHFQADKKIFPAINERRRITVSRASERARALEIN